MNMPGDFRDDLLDHLHGHIVGPYGGRAEQISELPYRRYLTAILYPQGASTDELRQDEIQDENGGSLGEDAADDPVTLANEWLPSSLGLSFRFSGGPTIRAEVWGATYEGGGGTFTRHPLADPDEPETVELVAAKETRHSTEQLVLDARAVLRCLWRPFGADWLVTVTLLNPRMMDPGKKRPDASDCLYQVGFRCRPGDGRILDYPSVDRVVADDEDEEIALIHRHARVFAIGHGTAPEWDAPASTPEAVRTEPLPRFELPAITQRWKKTPRVLSLAYLADDDTEPVELKQELQEFVGSYDEWIAGLPGPHEVPTRLEPAKTRILTRLEAAAARMRRGIDALDDPVVLKAFRLANLAMAIHMRHAEDDLGGIRKRRADAVQPPTAYTHDYTWYPFQLAFQLVTLAGLADREHDDRKIVDLIWFPTGGGKTEAYLAVAATEILLRRLRDHDRGAGTAVLTRYTLRLLTAQQFQRAATLTCALESIRRRDTKSLGRETIRIGLWVGAEVTPNRFAKAKEAVEEIRDAPEPQNVFQLDQCPWCGTEIVPRLYSDDDSDYGLVAGNDFFRFNCPNDDCPFCEELPVAVVDDELYLRPPTIVVGTVDKFAQLAWAEDAGALFGGEQYDPPSLIIQDELHLLSGPLGTMVGVYERAIETLCTREEVPPKVIASTATIRRADEQVRRLFGARVDLFPPSGLSADNSFFARQVDDEPGRLYIGLMSQSHTAATTNVQTSAALLLAPEELTVTPEERDALWTLVSYHNTLRELGRAVTQYRDDIPTMLNARARDQAHARPLDDDAVVELTGNVGAELLPSILARLFDHADDPGAISVLVTTSMLSVGVDVSRLGLMLVNGQPKTTAEYIQATSRVGRSAVPGSVVVMLSSTKPRDRSHYENFRAYHQALYSHIEPTSVTPFSLPARARALHAALVILVRHGAGLPANKDAMVFARDDPAVAAILDSLKRRIAESDPDEASATADHLDALAEEWESRVAECRDEGKTLHYHVTTRQLRSLLKDFGVRGPGWETPHSMRNVDRQVRVDIPGAGA